MRRKYPTTPPGVAIVTFAAVCLGAALTGYVFIQFCTDLLVALAGGQ